MKEQPRFESLDQMAETTASALVKIAALWNRGRSRLLTLLIGAGRNNGG